MLATSFHISMADNTQKMVSLLGRLRKQMNGAVADAMYYYGARYGLNYGVSLPTVRDIASQEGKDHDLALYLYKQQVRELRLAALHIADPQCITTEQTSAWAEGIINSEVAEEMAFALLPHAIAFNDIYRMWSQSENEFLAYTALMAASRSTEAMHIESLAEIVVRHPSSRIIAQGVVAQLTAAYTLDSSLSSQISDLLSRMGDGSTATYIREEIEWRLEALQ